MLTTEFHSHIPPIARLSSKGQVVIPREVRQALGFQQGMDLLFEPNADGSLHIRPVKSRSISELFGKLRIKGKKPKTSKDIDRAIMQAVFELDEATKTSSYKKPHKRK